VERWCTQRSASCWASSWGCDDQGRTRRDLDHALHVREETVPTGPGAVADFLADLGSRRGMNAGTQVRGSNGVSLLLVSHESLPAGASRALVGMTLSVATSASRFEVTVETGQCRHFQ
jgi:hypothetical protein